MRKNDSRMRAYHLLVLGLALGMAVSRIGHADPGSGSIGPVIDDLKRLAAAGRYDDAWASAVAADAEKLLEAGYVYRAAEWAVTLVAVRGASDPSGVEIIGRLPRRSLSDEELLYLGYIANRGGRAGTPALLALARLAEEERRPVTSALVAGARALGADSAGVVSIGAGWPAARRLGFFSIGLLAPVNGRLARQGEAMARGAQLAIEETNQNSRFRLALEIADTRGDPLVAARAAGELIGAGVGGIAGDLLVSTSIPAAAAAQAAAIPLVSPAPGRDDLATIGPYVFQSNAPRVIQAEAVARASVRGLGYQRIAILEPQTATGAALADHFAAEAGRLGARVVERLHYRPGETNFADLGKLASLSLEAVFIPGTPRELMAAIPQLAYYEVGGRVVGLEDLGLKEVLEATSEFLDGAVFTDSYYGVPPSGGETFAKRFARRFHSDPDAYAARGYVATRVLADAIASGARSPAAIRAALERRSVSGSGLLAVPAGIGEVALFKVTGSKGSVERLQLTRSD